MKKICISLLTISLLFMAVGCATKTTTTGTPAPPKLSPAKVAALEKITCNLGEQLFPNMSAADQTRVTNSCNKLQTDTANWQNGIGTSAQVLQDTNDALGIWQSINLGSASLNAKILEITSAFEAIVVVVS